MSGGIIYEYEDGGSYCGEWEGDTSHGFGACTGPKGQGIFEGKWEHGNQVSGVYRWPNGMKYFGTWQSNLRHGTGTETRLDGTEYSGEFTKGTRGSLGVAVLPNGLYKGQWLNGAQDGEGVETYGDQGCYRGQYKKGLRSGYGTRTSAAFESKVLVGDPSLPKSDSEPLLHSMIKQKSTTSIKSSKEGLLKFQKKQSLIPSLLKNIESSSSLQKSKGKEEFAQAYEGEWKDDRRHGYGVLKVDSLYTYYGQWVSNARTGYGVMMYENGDREEGEWHNGQLIVVLKRHKVALFKSHQLESKVKEARTKALQAKGKAKNMADLADSRAGSAVNKSRLAHQSAQRAQKDAQMAVEKAELYKNAPHVAEGVKSPMIDATMSFTTIDSPSTQHSRTSSAMSTASSSDSPKMSRLGVAQTLTASTSFENIHSVNVDKFVEDTESPLSLKKRFRHHRSDESSDSLSSIDDSLTLGADAASVRLKNKRENFYSGSTSEQSIEKLSPEMRRRLRRISDPTFRGSNTQNSLRRQGQHSWSLSDHEEEDEENYKEKLGIYQSSPRKRDKTTGEVGHGDATDEELLEEDRHSRLSCEGKMRTRLYPPRPLVKKNTMTNTMDMLNQMAKWNKMVAYINFALLIFLLFLILIVFASMYYYQLISYYKNHPDPEEHSSPGGFLTPLA